MRELRLGEVAEPQPASKLTGDGRSAAFIRYPCSARVYVVESDRVEGPVECDVPPSPSVRLAIMNDSWGWS